MPKISIIVPVYNTEKYLRYCIDSILNQSFTDFEIILVNDGSSDGCPQICDEYAIKDSRVKVVHKNNGGLSDARNVGIDVALGEYIGFVDSDDYIDKDMYQNLFQAIVENNADLSMCNLWYVDENNNDLIERNFYLPLKDGLMTNIEGLSIIHERNGSILVASCLKLYNKDLFSKRRFKTGKLMEDEFIFHHILYDCKRIACVSNPMYFYRQRRNSIMNKIYSIQNLDGVEAYNERIDFYNLKGLINLREKSEVIFGWLILKGCRKLDYSDEKVKERINELKMGFDRMIWNIIKNRRINTKDKITYILFYINPSLYKLIKKVVNNNINN